MAYIDPNAQTKLDMCQARQRTSVNVERIRDFVYNGREEWQVHHEVVDIISKDPVFDKSKRLFMNRTEQYHRGLAMTSRIFELAEKHGWSSQQINHATENIDDATPITLHLLAFEPVLLSQGSPEFLAKYGDLITNKGILGCYLQTELAHGSNVAQLETTATYIPESREFEIHSPTFTSAKWWVGGLGKFATHGVVQAKLMLPGGRHVGMHLFFVQLRSLEDHSVLPGIVLGDIGPKEFGANASLDNGFARFDRVRIPKENMLSKFAQVTDAGQYVQPPHAKISYGGMLYIRSSMVIEAGKMCAKAATVSIRYATVRRQGTPTLDGLETQVISYPSVYYRLLPILSHAYVFMVLGYRIINSYNNMSSRLAKSDTSLLAELHATTSGLKVLVTTITAADLEIARRSMGGHGYSGFSGLGRLYARYLPSTTFEGDNFVLDQQVVRAGLKSYKRFSSTPAGVDMDLSPSTYYLRLLRQEMPSAKTFAWIDQFEKTVELLEWRAALSVRERYLYQNEPDASMDQRVAKAISEAFAANQVGETMKNLKESMPEKECKALCDIYMLYLLTTVESALTDLLSFGLLEGSESGRRLRLKIATVCQELLPEAIGLTDSFGFTDWELDSATGVYNGDVYQTLWDKAQTEPLNEREVPDGYKEYIKPILLRGQRLAARSTKL